MFRGDRKNRKKMVEVRINEITEVRDRPRAIPKREMKVPMTIDPTERIP